MKKKKKKAAELQVEIPKRNQRRVSSAGDTNISRFPAIPAAVDQSTLLTWRGQHSQERGSSQPNSLLGQEQTVHWDAHVACREGGSHVITRLKSAASFPDAPRVIQKQERMTPGRDLNGEEWLCMQTSPLHMARAISQSIRSYLRKTGTQALIGIHTRTRDGEWQKWWGQGQMGQRMPQLALTCLWGSDASTQNNVMLSRSQMPPWAILGPVRRVPPCHLKV